MGALGVFGEIPFVVSAEQIRTFDELIRNTASRWEKHNIIGKKPKPEFVGPDLDTISFTMRFDVHFGMNPRKEMERLLEVARDGKALSLIIGGKGLGTYKWVIKSISQKWTNVDNMGNVLVGIADIELEEYPPPKSNTKPNAKKPPEPPPCKVNVKGKELQNKGFVQNGQAKVPMRDVAAALGKDKEIHWKKENGVETVTIAGKTLTTFTNKDGVGYAWSREIGELLGTTVQWKNGVVSFV